MQTKQNHKTIIRNKNYAGYNKMDFVDYDVVIRALRAHFISTN
jgi:hypothetical protein